MISEAMPTFLDKDLLMDVQYQKVTEKAKDYEFGYCLEFGYWDLGFLVYSGGGGVNGFNLNGLLSTLTFPWNRMSLS
jgi:hypothetical protein